MAKAIKHDAIKAQAEPVPTSMDGGGIALEEVPHFRCVYEVQWGSCPRRWVEAETEAAARARYLDEFGLVRPDAVPTVKAG
jgi:hypothetical protein